MPVLSTIDEWLQPEFDVDLEFAELITVQFMVLLGTVVFPIITVLAAGSFIVKYVGMYYYYPWLRLLTVVAIP